MNKVAIIAFVFVLSFTAFSGCFGPADNKPPIPNLTASDVTINAQEVVIFSANGSVDKDGEIVRYYWDFDDETNATGRYTEHRFEEGGNYTIVLIITDNDGKKAVQTITIHVNELPIPDIYIATQPAYIHEEVLFYANFSSDPDGFITSYHWDFGDGTNYNGTIASHRYSEKKNFNVTLTVTDNEGAKAATHVMFPIIFRTYLVEWETDSLKMDVLDNNGVLNEGNSTYFSNQIDKPNIMKIVFNITWDDTQPYVGSPPILVPEPNDKFILNVTSPDDQFYEGYGIESEKVLVVAPGSGFLNPKPPEFTQEAESKDILEDELVLQYTTYNGTGKWEINITCEFAHGLLGTPDTDPGESWEYNVVCHFYYPKITKLD
jgi:chitodextrinase